MLEESLEAELVLGGRRPAVDLLAGNEPEPPGGGVELVQQGPVKMGGAVAAGANPAEVGEHFQMPADGGLGQLENVAKLGHAELLTIQDVQNPQASGVG